MSETFFAVCPRGLESLLADELKACGAPSAQAAPGGASFSGTLATAYAANLHSRLASRILWRLGEGEATHETQLYDLVRAVCWEHHFKPAQTLRVDVSATRSPLRSLQFATLKVKDAIVDRMRERCGERPSVERRAPDVQVVAHLTAQRAQIYLDLSGEPLFKRGWRQEKGEAPLKENLAAGLLALSGWTPAQALHDPFCGSGTIVIEAACLATHRAPGLERRFAFEKLLGFDAAAWRALREKAAHAVDLRAPFQISASDISTRVVQTALANAQRAGLERCIQSAALRLAAADAREAPAPAAAGMIVTNPPYGVQSEPKSASVAKLMGAFGDQLKRAYPGWSAWMLSGDLNLPAQLKLKESRRTVLFNGPIECRFYRFDLVAGSFRRERREVEHRPLE